jgi:hypothetical protein
MSNHNEEFNPDDPMVDQFIKDMITEMFNKYREGKIIELEESEISVVEICIGYYPNDVSKQEGLAYCTIRATMETDPLNFRKVAEDKIIPLAIELGVESAIIQEILSIKSRQILGEENN